jgi:molybdenum cofactor biosynthesis enzyme MoaA
MDYILRRVSDLRQEITDLRNMNTRYSQRSEHSAIEQSAYELRTNRLLQIKKELSNMRHLPKEGAVWWEKLGIPAVSV